MCEESVHTFRANWSLAFFTKNMVSGVFSLVMSNSSRAKSRIHFAIVYRTTCGIRVQKRGDLATPGQLNQVIFLIIFINVRHQRIELDGNFHVFMFIFEMLVNICWIRGLKWFLANWAEYTVWRMHAAIVVQQSRSRFVYNGATMRWAEVNIFWELP